MADQDAAVAQGGAERPARAARRAGKEEIRRRIEHREPAAAQFGRRFGPGFADGRDGLFKIRLVVHRGGAGGLAHRVDVVGAVAELDPVHIGDQPRLADAEPEPRPGQAARFGKGAHNEQVVVFLHKRQAGCPRPGKIDIRLVHNHNVVGVCAHNVLNLRNRGQQARRRVGVRDYDRAAKAMVGGKVDCEILPQRQHPGRHAEQVAQNGVEAVGNIGESERSALIAERPDREQQVFVAAVAAEHPIFGHAAARGDGRDELCLPQVGVQPQPGHGIRHRGGDAGGRGIGVLVRVELDKVRPRNLLSGGIRLQRRQRRGKKSAHGCLPAYFSSSNRIVTLFAWACRPSRSAKSAMRPCTAPRASLV